MVLKTVRVLVMYVVAMVPARYVTTVIRVHLKYATVQTIAQSRVKVVVALGLVLTHAEAFASATSIYT